MSWLKFSERVHWYLWGVHGVIATSDDEGAAYDVWRIDENADPAATADKIAQDNHGIQPT